MLTATNHAGTYTYTYNAAGQVATQTDPFGLTLTYGYDAAGNVTSVADSLGGQTTSTYGDNGQLTSRTYTGPETSSPVRVGLSYAAAGQVVTLTRSRDLTGATPVGTTTYGYNAAGDVTAIQNQDGSGNVLANYQYNYGSAGSGASTPTSGTLSATAVADLLFSETDNGVTTNYGYDAHLFYGTLLQCNTKNCQRELAPKTLSPGSPFKPHAFLTKPQTPFRWLVLQQVEPRPFPPPCA